MFLLLPEISEAFLKRKSEEWKQIEEEITCSICGDLFIEPKTIPCLHTFCKQCIEKSIESNKKMASIVCCPLCRTPLAQDNISSVPTNFTINHFVEIFRKQKKKAALQCSSCKDDLPAITWCIECENSLCEYCNDAHKRIGAFISHTTIAVEEFIKNPKLVLSTPKNLEGKSEEWQQIEEEITCSICGDLFTDPKTIPCLHTFCKQCIEQVVKIHKDMLHRQLHKDTLHRQLESVLCCPLCRASFPPDISSIPTDLTISHLVKSFRTKKEADKS